MLNVSDSQSDFSIKRDSLKLIANNMISLSHLALAYSYIIETFLNYIVSIDVNHCNITLTSA